MTPAPDLRALDEALLRRQASDMRFEAALLALLVILPLFWLACFLGDSREPTAVAVLSATAGTFLVPAILIPCRLTPVERRILLNGGILRLLLPPLLPRRLPWQGPGVLSATGQAVGLSAHARLATAGWRTIQPWRLVPGAWIGRSAGHICVWRRIEEGWILVAARPDDHRPTSQEHAPSRSRP
jgi:hypothetical protein